MPKHCDHEVCDCCCGEVRGHFDVTLLAETRFATRLHHLCHSNILWFTEDRFEKLDSLKGRSGVYILWHKDGYCSTHDLFHMRALYVGKGRFNARLYSHWLQKDFSEEMLVYWSLVEMPNRHAKYVEQLLLDTYILPLNKSENSGTERLCAYLTQCEVD